MDQIKAKKRYGQNFLQNKIILENIANSIQVNQNDLIIEIGPGMGALTEFLTKLNCYFIAYEIDKDMQPFLAQYNTNTSAIIYGDFLEMDILKDIEKYNYNKIYVVANIPYYITSPILTKLLYSDIEIEEIVLLVQKEFAERICATFKTKEYNALTLFVDYNYDASILFSVNRVNFKPIPNVDSAVIKLTNKHTINRLDKEKYFKFIKDCFKAKRKTLKNNLTSYDFTKIRGILDELNYKENVRAEEIKKNDYKTLFQKYYQE